MSDISPQPQSTTDSLSQFLGYAAFVLACLMFIVIYMLNRSFIGDEIALTRNLIERDWRGLLRPLDYFQAAPLGFLLLSEALSSLLGYSEYAVRLLPLLFGLGSAFGLYRIGRQLAPYAPLFLLTWFATSNIMLTYSTTFKQYIGDVFFTIWLIDMAIRLSRQTVASRRDWLLWASVGAVGVWFSHPLALVIAGIGSTFIINDTLRRNGRRLTYVLMACAITFVSFVVFFAVSLQNLMAGSPMGDYMRDYWGAHYFYFDPLTFTRFVLVVFQYVIGFEKPFMLSLIVYLFAFMVGLRQLRLIEIGILLLHIPFALAVSSLGYYPLVQRFLLYLLPPIAIMTAVGMSAVTEQVIQAQRTGGWVIALLFCGILGWGVTLQQPGDYVPEAFAFIEARQADADIYVIHRGAIVGAYYGMQFNELTADDRYSPDLLVDGLTWFIFAPYDSLRNPDLYQAVIEQHNQDYRVSQTEIYCFSDGTAFCPDK